MHDFNPSLENSFEHLRLVVDNGHIGIWELDLRSGAAWRNQRHDRIFGYASFRDHWTYEDFLEHVVEEDRERVDQLQKAAIANREEWIFECRIIRRDGEYRWISAAGRPLLDDDGEVIKLIGHVIDVTKVKNNEDRLRLVNEELNHRVRNMLAMIRSIIRLSAHTAPDIDSMARALSGRVGALSRTHDLLVGEFEGELTLQAILEAEFAAFPGLEARTTLEGPDYMPLDGPVAQGLALVLHELITNAMKYGAFSKEEGRVTIKVAKADDGALTIRWIESGGPPLPAVRGEGFGSKLIERALGAHGRVTLDYLEAGLECTINLCPPVDPA